jgi:hypothetical protein
MASTDEWIKRFSELQSEAAQLPMMQGGFGGRIFQNPADWARWSTNVEHLIASCFGEKSVHYNRLKEAAAGYKTSVEHTFQSCRGVLDAAKRDFEGGYVASLSSTIAGEIFADLLKLARFALDGGNKDSAAVLAAAGFEDSLKKIGALYNLNVAEEELGSVIGALKAQQLLKGGAAQSADRYLKLRNWAMHANWEKIASEEVAGLIAFVDELLVKHLS